MKKVDFTCKKVALKDLVQCNYNLNDSEYLIFAELMKTKKGLSVKELVERIEKDRTTVQKILTKLTNRSLVMKRQMNLERGFMFIYFSKNRDEIVSEMEENINAYFNSIKISLEKWKNKGIL